MKKLLFPALIMVTAACTKPLPSEKQYRVEATVAGFTADSVYVESPFEDQLKAVKVTGETFEFSGEVPYPESFVVYLDRDQEKFIRLFVENAAIRIKAQMDSLSNPLVTGSAVDDAYRRYRANLKPLADSLKLLDQELSVAMKEGQMDLADSLSDAYQSLAARKWKRLSTYTKSHRDSWIVPYFLQNAFSDYSDEMLANEVMTFMSDSLKKSKRTLDLIAMIADMKRVAVGAPAPEFEGLAIDGTLVKLSALKGKVVLLDFWASWCGPCRLNHPDLTALHKKYGRKEFEMISISVDKEKDKWIKAIADDHLTWTQLCDLKGAQGDAAVKYGIQFIPANFLIDKTGVIIAKDLHRKKLRSRIDEVLELKRP